MVQPIITPSQKLNALHPIEWQKDLPNEKTTILEYRNLAHFKHHVSTITQKSDMNCDVSYKEALTDLLAGKSLMTEGDYQIIKNQVKNNLHKRGLISDNIYESYKYDVEGEIMDVARLAEGDPACFLVPNKTYKNYFYELYVSISYPWHVSNENVMKSMAKLLATVELLEREHYYCKITLIFPAHNAGTKGKKNFLSLVPLFSHRDPKTIQTMSSVLNDRLLRKFFFAILEDTYKSDIADGYGTVVKLPGAIIPVDLDECKLHKKIMNQIIEPCKSR